MRRINNRKEFVEIEFTALRNEILERLKFQHQLVSLNLIVAGTLFGIGLQHTSQPSVMLIIPILSMFLAAGWAHNNFRIIQIGDYIKNNFEKHKGGWQTSIAERYGKHNTSKNKSGSLTLFHARGVFISTQIVAIGLGLTKKSFINVDYALFAFDIVAILFVLFLLKQPNYEQLQRY